MEAEYLTVREAAELLRVNPKTVRRWIGKGELPAMKIGHTTRIAKSIVLNQTSERIEIPNEAQRKVDAMTPEEREAYLAKVDAELEAVRAELFAKYGVMEDSVKAIEVIRALGDRDE